MRSNRTMAGFGTMPRSAVASSVALMEQPVPLKLYCIAISNASFPIFDDMRAA